MTAAAIPLKCRRCGCIWSVRVLRAVQVCPACGHVHAREQEVPTRRLIEYPFGTDKL